MLTPMGSHSPIIASSPPLRSRLASTILQHGLTASSAVNTSAWGYTSVMPSTAVNMGGNCIAIDEILGGLGYGDVCGISGESSSGKTAVGDNSTDCFD